MPRGSMRNFFSATLINGFCMRRSHKCIAHKNSNLCSPYAWLGMRARIQLLEDRRDIEEIRRLLDEYSSMPKNKEESDV